VGSDNNAPHYPPTGKELGKCPYTKHDFVDGLKAEVAGGLDVVAVSRWAYRMFLEHIRALEDGLKPAIMQIVAMEEGPEFEMTLEELLAFADALLGER
jgi:hypothetical protein